MGQTGYHKNEGFGDFLEGRVPFLLDIQAKNWMVGRYAIDICDNA